MRTVGNISLIVGGDGNIKLTKKGVSAIAKQRTYTDADREQAFAEYTVLGNWELVSRKMGIPVNTLKSWWRRHPA